MPRRRFQVYESRSGSRILASRRLIKNNFRLGRSQSECLCLVDVQHRLHFIQVGKFRDCVELLEKSWVLCLELVNLALVDLAAFPSNAL